MIIEMEPFLKTALDLAQAGGRVLKEFWDKSNPISTKSSSIDLVTEADRTSEATILKMIKERHPDHAFLGEESGSWQSGKYLWVVDPLDGTINYAHRYPTCCVSIALVVDKEPIVGVVYNPFLEELFHASVGEGAFLNGVKLEISQNRTLNSSLLVSGFGYDRRENPDNNYAEFCRLTHLSQGVRRSGSAAFDLAYVAAGRFDGYWERCLNPWDMAAGALLVKEAGGVVTSYKGPFDLFQDRIVASNGHIHDELQRELAIAQRYPIKIN